MPEPSDVNVPLLMEQIKGVIQRQTDLAKQLEQLSERLQAAYIAKATYDAHREADDRRMGELEKDNDARSGFNRQVAAALIVAFVMQLILAVGVINNARGG